MGKTSRLLQQSRICSTLTHGAWSYGCMRAGGITFHTCAASQLCDAGGDTAGARTRRAPPSRTAHETQRAIKAHLERQLRAQLDESYAPAADAPGADAPWELWPTPLASPTPGVQTPGAARLNSVKISLAECEIQVRSIASLMDRLSDVFSADERASLKREAALLSLQGRLRVSTDD